MNQKGVKGNGVKYPCEDPQSSKKRGLTQYNDALHEVSSPPSKIPKVDLGWSRDYGLLNYKLEGEISNSDDDSDDEYEGTSDEGTSDDSGDETEEGEFEDNLINENEEHHMNTYKPIKKVRGPTKMKRMWKEYDPDSKIQLKFNRYGQPCGLKICKLTSFIGYLVRGKEIPLANKNWSKVDKSLKEKLWKTVQSAGKKWKDFKVVLKRKYFDPNLSIRQNINNGCANRISAPQWVWLVNHWKSNKSQLKSEKNKAARAQQLNGRHTTGSRSNAVVLDQLELKEGRKIGRAELFIATHTRRNGQAIDDYSGDKINEIKKGFQEDPSLIAEETNDNDFFSTLFPKERIGRRRGLGLLAGGVASSRIYEALVEMQEVREENKKLWSVVETLMSNQTKLQQQYDELKSQGSATQRCPSVESSPKVDLAPRDQTKLHHECDEQKSHASSPQMFPSVESSPKIDPTPRDLPQAIDGDNQGDSMSHPNKRPRTQLEETNNVVLPSQQKKNSTLQQKLKEKTSPQSLQDKVKKPRKFHTPLHKDEMKTIKCGMEVGLASPNSKRMVAMGTIQKTDSKAKACDGHPLADCVEVLVSVVFNQMTMLPRAHGKIQKLGSAIARSIAWPRQNIMRLKVNTVRGSSQTVDKSKQARKMPKEKINQDVTKKEVSSK